MPTGLTLVNVANLALDMVKEAPINDLTDATTVARWMSRNIAVTRDSELEAHPWKFSLSRRLLARLSAAPAYGWDYQYELPSDCLRPLPLREDGEWEGNDIIHEIEGHKLLCDEAGPLYFRYIARQDGPGTWTNLFAETVAAKLAAKVAHYITGKASFAQVAGQYYQDRLDQAKRTNSLLSSPERAAQHEVIDIRFR